MTLVFDLLNTIQSIDREIQADVEGNGEEEVLDVKNHIAEMKMSDLMDSPPILMSLSDKARKVVEKEEKKGDIGAKRTSSSQVVEFNSLDNSKFDFSVYFVKQQVKVEFPQKSSLSNTIEPISYLRISITLQLPQIPSETKISLKIPEEAAIFSSLILTCVRTYNNSQPKRPLVENSDAYVITVDGRAMSPFTKVRKILIGRNFVLKENTDYKKNAFEVPLSVSLPGGIIHTSTFSSTVRAVNVLLDICKRFNLEPTRHSITLDGKVLAPDVLLEKIQDGCVAIVERSLDQQSSGDVTSGDTFWFFHLAQKYKRYNVTHILKIGAKYKYQNATLGDFKFLFLVKRSCFVVKCLSCLVVLIVIILIQ
eukprot:TRINITY_DN3423_c0_g1_i2.p1 TRINITY_DN3423_c0_g1~~TRINITY_DN3423_c0_g1_i2.p1  ORF type:complete len:366 (-),score=79.01 TRINITY_DN3423_c0_g1_i2:329-1426(-)